MTYYLVSAKFRAHSIAAFLQSRGASFRDRLLPLAYHELFRATSLSPGILILTHVESGSPSLCGAGMNGGAGDVCREAGKRFIRDRLIARLPAIPDPPKQRS